MLIIHCRLREAGVQPEEHCDYMHVHARLRFIITLPIVIKPSGHYYPFRSMRQDGLGVSGVPGYPGLQAASLTKINIDGNLTNGNLGVLKQTLWKLSCGIFDRLSAALAKRLSHYCSISEHLHFTRETIRSYLRGV